DQKVIDGPAEAGSNRCDPASVAVGDHNVARNGGPAVDVAGPVEVPFAADDELADLIIAADLTAADEYAVADGVGGRQEARVRPAAAGPGTANVSADVESGPTEYGRRRWRRGLDRDIRGSGDRCTQHTKRYARDQCPKIHGVPL